MFWNIWLNNQINGAEGSTRLFNELERLANIFKPDFIGLNEVLQSSHANTPFISDFLNTKCGYTYSHFAPASPFTDNWTIGSALYSRVAFDNVKNVSISKDAPAEKRGYEGFEIKSIAASVIISGTRKLNIIVTHPVHLRKHTLSDHYEGTSNLEKLIRSEEFSKNTILGGDFNEPKFMPNAFKNKVSNTMNFRTGSMRTPTWHHNAHSFTPLRANLDQLYWTKNSDFKLKEFKILKTNVSDHRPIFATFEY